LPILTPAFSRSPISQPRDKTEASALMQL
jgi:hypothetical protein